MEVWRKASDGPGEARAAGAKKIFYRRGDCILLFESSARFWLVLLGISLGIETFIPLC